MADQTAIEWTQATWNPTVGCSLVSPGCTNCYAMQVANRLQNNPDPNVADKYAGLTTKVNGRPVWTGQVRLWPPTLSMPLKRRRPTTYFVDSQSDLFHEGLPDDDIDRVFAIMALCPQHTFQILTKRPARMRQYLTARDRDEAIGWRAAEWTEDAGTNGIRLPEQAHAIVSALIHGPGKVLSGHPFSRPSIWPMPNVWLGVSAEDQQRADERIPELLATPAALRFVSCEPLLGPVDLAPWLAPHRFCEMCDAACDDCPNVKAVAFGSEFDPATGNQPIRTLDWVIVGGESGPNARPMHPAWVRALRDQCAAANVPFFFKQWGEYAPMIVTPGSVVEATPEERARVKSGAILGSEQPVHVGKKRAGRHLDGDTWDQMPGLEGAA